MKGLVIDTTMDSVLLSYRGDEIEVISIPYTKGILLLDQHLEENLLRKEKVLVSLARFLSARLRKPKAVIVPSIFLKKNFSRGFKRRFFKAGVQIIMMSPMLQKAIQWILAGKAEIIVIDYSDYPEMSEVSSKVFHPKRYFKLNLRESDRLNSPEVIFSLPMPIGDLQISSIVETVNSTSKKFDIFIAGDFSSPERKKQLEAAEILLAQGYKVCVLRERGREKFIKLLSESHLCFVGRGVGGGSYCIRHCEAAAAKSAIVMHEPVNQVHNLYENTKNAFVYSPEDSPEEIARTVIKILANKKKIEEVAQEAFDELNATNKASVLAELILKKSNLIS